MQIRFERQVKQCTITHKEECKPARPFELGIFQSLFSYGHHRPTAPLSAVFLVSLSYRLTMFHSQLKGTLSADCLIIRIRGRFLLVLEILSRVLTCFHLQLFFWSLLLTKITSAHSQSTETIRSIDFFKSFSLIPG